MRRELKVSGIILQRDQAGLSAMVTIEGLQDTAVRLSAFELGAQFIELRGLLAEGDDKAVWTICGTDPVLKQPSTIRNDYQLLIMPGQMNQVTVHMGQAPRLCRADSLPFEHVPTELKFRVEWEMAGLTDDFSTQLPVVLRGTGTLHSK